MGAHNHPIFHIIILHVFPSFVKFFCAVIVYYHKKRRESCVKKVNFSHTFSLAHEKNGGFSPPFLLIYVYYLCTLPLASPPAKFCTSATEAML